MSGSQNMLMQRPPMPPQGNGLAPGGQPVMPPQPPQMPPPGPPQGPPAAQPPASQQAAYAQRMQGMQFSPEQIAQQAQASEALISELAQLVRGKGDPSEKDVVKGIDVVLKTAPGAFSIQAARQFLEAMPDDPKQIKPFLQKHLQNAIAGRVHLAAMAQAALPAQGAPPQGQPSGPPPAQLGVPPNGG